MVHFSCCQLLFISKKKYFIHCLKLSVYVLKSKCWYFKCAVHIGLLPHLRRVLKYVHNLLMDFKTYVKNVMNKWKLLIIIVRSY